MNQYGYNANIYPYRGYQEQQYRDSQNIFATVPATNSSMDIEDGIPNIEPPGLQHPKSTNIFPKVNPQSQDYNLKAPNLYQEPQKRGQSLKESVVSLFENLGNLVAAYAPSEDKEQLRSLVNQAIQDYPELESKLQVLLQTSLKKINQPSRAEIPNGGCQHYGAERYTPICKQSHCKECLRELIFADPENSQQIACPCGIGLSRKNKDEIAPELNPYIKKQIGNSINIPAQNFSQGRPQADLKQNFKPAPQSFQENVEKQSPPQLQKKPIPPANQNKPQPKIFAAENKKHQNPLPPNQIIPKRIPENQSPPKYQHPPELPKNKNPRSGPRIDANKLACTVCSAVKDIDNFTAITCSGHDICSTCRVIYLQRSHECPKCYRVYSDSEIEMISILAATLPPEELNVPQNQQNFERQEEFICIHCGNKIAKSETHMYECMHPLHIQCQTPTGCPVCGY
ncbi:unnamed protein product [Blepharisma stoltei]|uniref:RING-type domain-containing protein n=1 Tax=Blepharisma stoltei TaxID=1481888 RepID=A0AAU9I985_9CILI|nr:unnamed protein product [Blepharisma stoltei]